MPFGLLVEPEAPGGPALTGTMSHPPEDFLSLHEFQARGAGLADDSAGAGQVDRGTRTSPA
jgi:hypothetical protein